MSDARESFRRELESVNAEHTEELREIRSHEFGDTARVKEELTDRYQSEYLNSCICGFLIGSVF